MGKVRSGSIRERPSVYFAQVKFTDENGKSQEIERKANNQKQAQKLLKEILNELAGRDIVAVVSKRIRERRGGIFARVTFTDESGERHEIERKAENRTHAKDLIKQILRDLDDYGETIFTSDKLNLGEYLDQWLQSAAKPRLSERTYRDYQEMLERYVRPFLAKKMLSNVRPLDIQSLYTDMQERGLSARTVRYTHAILSSALKQAVKWRMLSQNPAALVDLPKQARREMYALHQDEATRFLKAAATDRYGVLFMLAIETGARPEEYLALKWSDINLQAGGMGKVRIQRTLVWRRKGGGWSFGEPKTARSRRTIPISDYMVRALIEHKRIQAEERLRAGPKYKNLDLVFTTPQGGPLLIQNLMKRHFKPILESAKLNQSIRLYDLRHSTASLMLAMGENPKVVSERLGHASVTLTLDTYSHVLAGIQGSATEKLGNLLFASNQKKKAGKK